MFTSVEIHGLRVFGYHGLFDEERRLGQQFSIDLEVELSDNGSHRADDLTSSVRYDKLIATAVRVVSGPSHATVEVLAEALAIAILGEFKLVEAVRVGVAKLHPPMNEIVEQVGISVKVARTDLEKLTASPS